MQRAVLALFVIGGVAASAQAQSNAAGVPSEADHASAYYYYSLAHMYAELAGAYGNRGEYVNKAIENYKLAIKADPKTPLLSEELSELYVQSGRLREAEADAQETLKQNPNDLTALRLLARIYTRQIGDSQQNRIDEGMLRKSVEEYQLITKLDPKDADSWLMLGRLQKVMQNSVEAENAYKKVLELDPDNEDALTGLATVYADLGNNKAAADLLSKLAEKNPSPRSLRALAAAYEQMREFPLAAEALKKVLALGPPDESEIKHELAQDQTFAEQYADALQTYQDLIAAEPNDAQSYLRMSQIYLQMKDFAKAREASDKARAIEPDNIEIRYSLVSILQAEGKTADAIQLLKDILDSTQKQVYNQGDKAVRLELLERLGALYSADNQVNPAVDTFRKIGDLEPAMGPRASAEIIDTYRLGKEYPKAEQEADAAVKKWPMDRDVRVTRDNLLADLGKTDAAASDIKKLLDGKNDRETYMSLAEIYEKGKKERDDMAKALDAAEKLSDSKQDKQNVWFLRGAMYERMKKVEPAEVQFRKILDVDPNNAAALNYLGYMLADRNLRLQEALGYITKAVDQDPNNGAYLDSLGWVDYKLGRLDDAEANMRRAVDHTPHDASIRDHYGDVLMRQSKLKDAIAQWELSLKEWETSSPSDLEPAEMNKVKNKLESAKVRLAKETGPGAKR